MIIPKANSELRKLNKDELIQIVHHCYTMEHVADILMQYFNQSPEATNYLGWQFKRVNQKTGATEDFELMIRRTEGKTTLEILAGLTKKYRELEADNQTLIEACKELAKTNEANSQRLRELLNPSLDSQEEEPS